MRGRLTLAAVAALLALAVFAQQPAPKQPVSRPAWSELTPAQHEALAPLAGHWDTLDERRKRKWLDIAANYAKLSADGKERVHRRMAEFAALTPQQKQVARENFKRAYELPSDQRQSLLREYEALPEDKKRELEAQAKSKPPAKATRKTEPTR